MLRHDAADADFRFCRQPLLLLYAAARCCRYALRADIFAPYFDFRCCLRRCRQDYAAFADATLPPLMLRADAAIIRCCRRFLSCAFLRHGAFRLRCYFRAILRRFRHFRAMMLFFAECC